MQCLLFCRHSQDVALMEHEANREHEQHVSVSSSRCRRGDKGGGGGGRGCDGDVFFDGHVVFIVLFLCINSDVERVKRDGMVSSFFDDENGEVRYVVIFFFENDVGNEEGVGI